LAAAAAVLPLDVLDMRVWAREKQALVATVGPAHQVRTAAVCSGLQDLAVSNRPVQRARGHNDPIADFRLHRVLLSVSANRAVRSDATSTISGSRVRTRIWLFPALPNARLVDRAAKRLF
jgi:hypothetical protein